MMTERELAALMWYRALDEEARLCIDEFATTDNSQLLRFLGQRSERLERILESPSTYCLNETPLLWR